MCLSKCWDNIKFVRIHASLIYRILACGFDIFVFVPSPHFTELLDKRPGGGRLCKQSCYPRSHLFLLYARDRANICIHLLSQFVRRDVIGIFSVNANKEICAGESEIRQRKFVNSPYRPSD